MLFRNLYIENAEKLQDIRVEEGVITEIGEALLPREGEEQQDFGGKLALLYRKPRAPGHLPHGG